MDRARLRTGLLLGALAFAVYSANLREISSGDTIPARLLPVAVVRDGAVKLDRFFDGWPPGEPLPYAVVRIGDHYVSRYPILPGLLAVPAYGIAVLLGGGQSWPLLNAVAKTTAAGLTALSVVVVYLAARQLTSGSVATAVALVYGFGTSSWAVSSQGLWGHGPAQLFLAVALYGLVRPRLPDAAALGLGLAVGLMVAARPSTVPAAVIVVAGALWRDRRGGLSALAGAASVALLLLGYNLRVFGSADGGYQGIHADQALGDGLAGLWSTPFVEGLLGLLVSPSRGLLVYSPVLVLAVGGLWLAVRDARRPVMPVCAAIVVAGLLLFSRYAIWWGGHSFGPRYASDLLPALALLLIPAGERILAGPRIGRAAFGVLFGLSVVVQAVGAACYPGPPGLDWNSTPRNVDQAPERVWDWRDSQLLRLLRTGLRAPGFGDS